MSGERLRGAGLSVVPEIPGNTGNIIRLAAVAGFDLHVAGPTLFDFSDARLRRAGLDYHDLAVMTEHENLEAAYHHLGIPAAPASVPSAGAPAAADEAPRLYAFTGEGTTAHTDITYRPGDTLLFGRESTGLDAWVKRDPRLTATVRIPMLPGRRSLNLANSVSVAVFEAWRQRGFQGAA